MAAPQNPYEAVLRAAAGVTVVETALEAELLGAALLGGVYAIAEVERAGEDGGDRASAVEDFVGRFLQHTARRRTAAAHAIRSVFASLTPGAPGAAAVRPGPHPPPWAPQLGQVKLTGVWAYGDVYGDQTSYLVTFAYLEPETGGGEHAVVVLVDHNIGIVKDLFVSRAGLRVLEQVRLAAQDDELVWLTEVDPARARAEVAAHLAVTDCLSVLPEEGSLATDRVLAGARLAHLPTNGQRPAPPTIAPPARLVAEFLTSPQAATLAGPASPSSLQYAVRLILDFAEDSPDADPLRWSPAVAGLFLLDWVHRRAVLDDDDVALLPAVLRAWTAWAADRRELPAVAAEATTEAIDAMAPELARLQAGGGARAGIDIPRPRG